MTFTTTADTGSTFNGWSGDSDCSDGVVNMIAGKTCTATFTLNTPPPGNGASGRVTDGSGAGVSEVTMIFSATCSRAACPPIPPAVQTEANGNWSQAGFQNRVQYKVTPYKTGCTFNLPSLNFTVPNANMNFIATCGNPSVYTLTVTKAGTGSGTVTSSPNGINCGSDCSENYSNNTQVTFTAMADTGSTFAGWGGDTDCSDGVVNMTAHRACTAEFDTIPVQGNADIAVSRSTLEFEEVRVRASKTSSFIVMNEGTGTLTVANMTISGRDASLFRVVSDSNFAIGPSLSNTVSVRFTPRSTGEKEATLKIFSNDPDTPVLSIKLKGEGKR